MSKAFKCDRCGQLFEERKWLSQEGEVYETNTNFFRIKFRLDVQTHGSDYEPELCLKCRADIIDAIRAKFKPVVAHQSTGAG